MKLTPRQLNLLRITMQARLKSYSMPKDYTYTLTPSECISAFGENAVKPVRSISISLILLGVFAAIMFYELRPLVGSDHSKIEIVRMAYIFAAICSVLGCLLWKPEGQRSSKQKTSEFLRTHKKYITEAHFAFDSDGWKLQRLGASEDVRKFASMIVCRETPELIILVTDTAHIVPKRILSPADLSSLRGLCGMEDTPPGGWRNRSLLDEGMAAIEYVPRQNLQMAFVVLFVSVIASGLASVRIHVGAASGLEEITIHWARAIGTLLLSICVLPVLYFAASAIKHKQLKYGSITEAGFFFVFHNDGYCVRWPYATRAWEGFSSFFFEPQSMHYHAFPKRLLSAKEKEMLKQKVAEKQT